MRTSQDIIVRPIITEKSYAGIAEGKYTFEVAVDSTKVEIKKAVEELFGVKVKKVNTMNYDGKMKRMGVHQGRRKSWKKAIVTIDTNPEQEKYLVKGGKSSTVAKKYKTEIEEISSALNN